MLIKDLGAVYLFYLGLTVLITSFRYANGVKLEPKQAAMQNLPFHAICQGLLTNVLNPRAALFYISLFSQFVRTSTPLSLKVAYAAINWSVTLEWFALLAVLISGKLLSCRIERVRHMIDRTLGGILMSLSVILLLS